MCTPMLDILDLNTPLGKINLNIVKFSCNMSLIHYA